MKDRVIDVQAHFTTPEYLQMMERHGALLEDGFPLPDWTPEAHLEVMDTRDDLRPYKDMILYDNAAKLFGIEA